MYAMNYQRKNCLGINTYVIWQSILTLTPHILYFFTYRNTKYCVNYVNNWQPRFVNKNNANFSRDKIEVNFLQLAMCKHTV